MSGHGFGDRLYQAMRTFGPVCVGIDPHASLLASWGLGDDVEGLRSFSMTVVGALGGRVAAFKPQSAFYERFGSRGMGVLEETIAACREAGSLCIVDAKRGDIGSTMAGYAEAFLGEDSPLAGDAVTVSPYLGVGSLAPALDHSRHTNKGIFVLALTSNPEGKTVQHARLSDGTSVAAHVVQQLTQHNSECDFDHMASVGVVVGATVGEALASCNVDLPSLRGPILAPGVGAQGAGAEQVKQLFNGIEDRVLASTSRQVLQAGPSYEALQMAHISTVESLRGLSNSSGETLPDSQFSWHADLDHPKFDA